jgi:hypothetical protein
VNITHFLFPIKNSNFLFFRFSHPILKGHKNVQKFIDKFSNDRNPVHFHFGAEHCVPPTGIDYTYQSWGIGPQI